VERISGNQFAKTVIVKTDRGLVMAVLPGDHIISLEALKSLLGCETLTLATETEFVDKFPTCEPGAMPPFGRLFGLPLYCDNALSIHDEIEFNAGTHMDTIRMRFADYLKLEKPVLASFSKKCAGERFVRIA